MHGARPLRIAFIGGGAMASQHLQALRRVPTPHQVVGVHDLHSAAAEAFAQRASSRAYSTVAELLESTRADLVHICTPAGTHFEPARQALLAGAHVYVEKPFVETLEEAETLFALARRRALLICAGHQLVRDPAFVALMRRASALQPITAVDSEFAFRPPRLDPYRATRAALAQQLLDVLPHPLYTLVEALERSAPAGAASEIVNVSATPTALHALVKMDDVIGRLSVSLRARPVASTLKVAGAHGSLTTDFVRGIVLGAANEGTSPIEKIANPFLEAAQLAWWSAVSLAKRFIHGTGYPGLAELLAEFYAAAARGLPSPVGVEHLRRVTVIYEQLAANVRNAVGSTTAETAHPTASLKSSAPLAVLTGAAGFLGRAIARELARRGFRVRGIGRSGRPDDPHVHEWIPADLAAEIPRDALVGASIVVHAAAETSGGFKEHERNTVGATRQLLAAMVAANVQRLVHVSSISVLAPPQSLWEQQNEQTPLPLHAEQLGPYTWGKCAAEQLVSAAHARGEIQARIIRPAALIDWGHLEVPGLLGRRLFGRWHLGYGRAGVPLAVCDVGRAGAAIAWCAEHFSEAPTLVNLLDPAIHTRGQLLSAFRTHGWRGRVIWVPISFLAAVMGVVRVGMVLARRKTRPPAVWSVLRPRRYDPAVSAELLAVASQATAQPVPRREPAIAHVGQVYG